MLDVSRLGLTPRPKSFLVAHRTARLSGAACLSPKMLRLNLAIIPFSLLLVSVLAARPVIKIGLTSTTCGNTAGIAVNQAQSLRWWANDTNARGGITVNGTVYDVNFVMCAAFPLPQASAEFRLVTTMRSILSSLVRSPSRLHAAHCDLLIDFPSAILYDRLVNVDKVDLLMGPFGTNLFRAAPYAQQYKIPMMNIGDFTCASL